MFEKNEDAVLEVAVEVPEVEELELEDDNEEGGFCFRTFDGSCAGGRRLIFWPALGTVPCWEPGGRTVFVASSAWARLPDAARIAKWTRG
jgi:hypothetical protein